MDNPQIGVTLRTMSPDFHAKTTNFSYVLMI